MKRVLIIIIIATTTLIGFEYYTTPAEPNHQRAVIIETPAPLPTPYDELLKHYEKYINQSLELTGTPGAAIAIIQDTSIIYLKGFGVKSTETKEPINTHTAFRLGSVSKSLTGVLMGLLVQNNKLAWDDSIHKYLPEFRLKSEEYTQQLTIRHVLSQTTGLPYHAYTNLIEEGTPHDVLIQQLQNVNSFSEPGKVYSYQNVAYSLVDDVVLAATGNSFAKEMNSRLFGPLRMTNASVTFEAFTNNPNIAQPHLYRKRSWKPVPISSTYYNTAPAGGVNASITDMAKLMVALLGNKENVITQNTIDQLFEPEVRATAKNRNFNKWQRIKRSYYGLGWRVLTFKNDTLAYHGGYVNGFRSEIAIHPKDKIAICVLANGPSRFSDLAIPEFLKFYDKYYKAEEKLPELLVAR